MTILAASRFTICLHRAKIKYFQCLNTILGKIGDVHVVGLILSLIASNCTPVLVYGVEACLLSKAQLLSISYAYNAVFVKLFKSFDVKTIRACQFYTNFLSAEHSIGAARLKFLSSLSTGTDSPAGFLCKAVGAEEVTQLTTKYGVRLPATNRRIMRQVWEVFENEQNG